MSQVKIRLLASCVNVNEPLLTAIKHQHCYRECEVTGVVHLRRLIYRSAVTVFAVSKGLDPLPPCSSVVFILLQISVWENQERNTSAVSLVVVSCPLVAVAGLIYACLVCRWTYMVWPNSHPHTPVGRREVGVDRTAIT